MTAAGRARVLRHGIVILALGFTAACGDIFSSRLPAIADGLPADGRGAEMLFDKRVKSAFPLGSRESDVMSALAGDGFAISPPSADGFRTADLKRGNLICQTIWSVRWTAKAGVIRALFGIYGSRCP